MKQTLQQLNKLRKIVKLLKIALLSGFILIFLSFILGISLNLSLGPFLVTLFIFLFSSGIALAIFQSKYTNKCNYQLISKLVPSVDPYFTYGYHSGDRQFIKNSHLFGHPDRVSFHHILQKKEASVTKGIYIVDVSKESENSEGNTHSHLLFKGVIFTFQSSYFSSTHIQFLNKTISNNLSKWFTEKFTNDQSFLTSTSSILNSLYSIKQTYYDHSTVSLIEDLLLSLHERGYDCLASVSEGTFYLALSTNDFSLSFPTRQAIIEEDLRHVKEDISTLTALSDEIASVFPIK